MSKKNLGELSVTEEDIEKALDELEEEAALIEKGAEGEEEEEKDEEGEEKDEKEEDDAEGEDDDDDEEEKEEEGEEKEKDEVEKAEDDDDDDDEEEEEEKPKRKLKKAVRSRKHTEEVEKAVEVSPFLKGLVDELTKNGDEIRKALGNVAVVVRDLSERMDSFEEEKEAEPRQRKSRINKSSVGDRFSKGNRERDEDEEEANVVGLVSGRRKLLSIMDGMAFGDNNEVKDPEIAKAIISLEGTHTMSPSVMKRIEERGKIRIDPRR